MKKQRKHYTGEERAGILRRHLLDQEPVLKLCDELGLRPRVFHRWQKEFFENGAAAFQKRARSNPQAEQEKIEYLEKKIHTKDEVLAELMAERKGLEWQNCEQQAHEQLQLARMAGGMEMTPMRVQVIVFGCVHRLR